MSVIPDMLKYIILCARVYLAEGWHFMSFFLSLPFFIFFFIFFFLSKKGIQLNKLETVVYK